MAETYQLDVEALDPTHEVGPDDKVAIRYGDLVALTERADGVAEETRKPWMRDLERIMGVLGLSPADGTEVTAAQLVNEYILPRCRALMLLQGQMDDAERQMRENVKNLGLPEVDFGGGRKGVLAGRRIPGMGPDFGRNGKHSGGSGRPKH